ncbi:MAG: hypothetical protein AAB152_17990 [Candidatus Coatesbacteria bacterium]
MNVAEAWQTRLAQWKAFERWHRDDDPANRVSPQEALQWAGEMLEWHERRFGPPPAPVPEDYAGVRLMHERLALLPR